MLVMVTGARDETTPDSKVTHLNYYINYLIDLLHIYDSLCINLQKTAASALKNSAGVTKEFKDAPKSAITNMASGKNRFVNFRQRGDNAVIFRLILDKFVFENIYHCITKSS